MNFEAKKLRVVVICVVFIALILNIDRYVYFNVTGSLPRGIYLAVPGELHKGDYVVYDPSKIEKRLLRDRGYSDPGKPVLKQVGALENDVYTITRKLDFYINGEKKGEVIPVDAEGRFMPYSVGSFQIEKDEFLPYAPAKRSLDGRYFGPEHTSQIINKVIPICTEIW